MATPIAKTIAASTNALVHLAPALRASASAMSDVPMTTPQRDTMSAAGVSNTRNGRVSTNATAGAPPLSPRPSPTAGPREGPRAAAAGVGLGGPGGGGHPTAGPPHRAL